MDPHSGCTSVRVEAHSSSILDGAIARLGGLAASSGAELESALGDCSRVGASSSGLRVLSLYVGTTSGTSWWLIPGARLKTSSYDGGSICGSLLRRTACGSGA